MLQSQLDDNKEMVQKLIEFYKLARKLNFINEYIIDKTVSGFCVKNQMPDQVIYEIFKAIYDAEYDEKTIGYIIKRAKEKPDLSPGSGVVVYHAKQLLNSGLLTNDEKKFVKDFIETIKRYRIDKDNIDLPNYLEGVENVYLVSSKEKYNKKKGVYYIEKYFVEKDERYIKMVWYIEIESDEPNAIYKKHIRTDRSKRIGVKIEIKRVLKNVTDKTTTYEVLIGDKFTFIPSSDSTKLNDIINEISLKSITYTFSFNRILFKEYFTVKLKEYFEKHGENPMPCLVSKSTGWNEDNTMFFHYDLNDEKHELHKEHLLYKDRKAKSFNQKEQHELVYKLLKEGKLLGVLLSISASSILLKPFNLQPIVCVISGEYGVGKTKASLIATSLFYESEYLLIDLGTVKIGFDQIFSSLNSLPFVIDEDRLTSWVVYNGGLAFLVTSLKYAIFSELPIKGKAYNNKYLVINPTNLKSNMFWNTEVTNIDEIRTAGTIERMFYIDVKSWDQFTSLPDVDYSTNGKYAGCGVDYIKFVMDNMESLKERVAREKALLDIKHRETIDVASTIYAGIILLEEFYTKYFGLSQPLIFMELRQTVDNLLDNNKNVFIPFINETVFEFYQYLYNNFDRFGRVERIENGRYIIMHRPKSKKDLGEYDIVTKAFYITPDGFDRIAKDLKKDRKQLIDVLIQVGFMEKRKVRYYSKTRNSNILAYKVEFSRM